jgi:transposase
MTINKHYSMLLGLDADWKVSGVQLDLEGKGVEVALEFTGKKATCPECGEACPIADHAPERTWRHLDTMQFETVLRARVPRSQCGSCGVKTAAVPWAEKHSRFTLMFEIFAIEVIKASSDIKKASALLRLHWESAHTIMGKAVERGLARRETGEVSRVGIDEKSFRRSQSYITILNDLDGGRVLEVVEGRKEEDAKGLLASLGKDGCSRVKAIAMDMWPAFINAAQAELPGADIVFDKFHVSGHLNKAVDEVRRKENAQLLKGGVETLKGSRFSWLRSPDTRSQKQTFYVEGLRRSSLKTARAWAIKEFFNDGYWGSRNEAFGETLYKRWYAWAIRSRLEPIKKVARMVKKHLWGLQNWFLHGITNAVSEGLNSRIQAIKSASRGFRSFKNYRTRILFFCGKLEMRPNTTH